MSGVDAVLLDAGGILILPGPEHVLRQLAGLGLHPTADTLTRAHYFAVAEMDASGREHALTYRTAYLRSCGADDEQAAVGAAHLSFSGHWSEVVPGAVETLAALRATGRKVAVVSNSDGSVERQLAEAGVCRAGDEVDLVVDSYVVGADKPDPRIFWDTLAALDVPADRAVHVGDTLRTDVDGATAAGVRPVHLDPYGDCREPDGHLHLRRLADLVPLVARL